MLDGVSLDQLRTFIAAAELGSFSAAGRRLGRAQSVVSQTIANLEGHLGLLLFERTGRLPRLTDSGRSLLPDARAVAENVDVLKVRARGMAAGLEPELSVVAEVMFPMPVLTRGVRAFAEAFPSVPMRLQVEALGAVAESVLSGASRIGLFVPFPMAPPGLVREPLLSIDLVMVAAASHPLARETGPIPAEVVSRHVQLVLGDRSSLTEGRDFGVFSSRTWRLFDLGAKHAFLLDGLGWGGMPLAAVERDLAEGRLVELSLADAPGRRVRAPICAVYRPDAPPGPAGRWLIDQLRSQAVLQVDGAGAKPSASAFAIRPQVSSTP